MLRDAVRSLAEAKIAPYDRRGVRRGPLPTRGPPGAGRQGPARRARPEEYGSAGADALATVIEEGAQVCATSSFIPAVMAPLAKGEGMFSYCLSESDASSDAAGMKTKAVRDGDFWVLNGVKRWTTNAD